MNQKIILNFLDFIFPYILNRPTRFELKYLGNLFEIIRRIDELFHVPFDKNWIRLLDVILYWTNLLDPTFISNTFLAVGEECFHWSWRQSFRIYLDGMGHPTDAGILMRLHETRLLFNEFDKSIIVWRLQPGELKKNNKLN